MLKVCLTSFQSFKNMSSNANVDSLLNIQEYIVEKRNFFFVFKIKFTVKRTNFLFYFCILFFPLTLFYLFLFLIE